MVAPCHDADAEADAINDSIPCAVCLQIFVGVSDKHLTGSKTVVQCFKQYCEPLLRKLVVSRWLPRLPMGSGLIEKFRETDNVEYSPQWGQGGYSCLGWKRGKNGRQKFYRSTRYTIPPRGCPFCRFMLQQFCAQRDPRPFFLFRFREGVMIYSASSLSLVIQPEPPKGAVRYPFVIAKRTPETQSGETFNPQQARQWLEACQMSSTAGNSEKEHLHGHGKCRHAWTTTNEPIQVLLIDVFERCLVPTTTAQRYVALSYVWGRRPFLRTTVENYKCLRERNSISPENHLPILFEDAMEFVRSIGERYLWIDALCIVQNDVESKRHAIASMREIYTQAYFTIVAHSATSAHSPLPGLRKGTRSPFVSEQATGTSIRITKIESSEPNEHGPKESYSSRGWTFQELLVSPRCIVFHREKVVFRCCSGQFSEVDEKNDPRPSIPEDFQLLCKKCLDVTPWKPQGKAPMSINSDNTDIPAIRRISTDFTFCARLISRYSERQLTFQADILNAFSALEAVLADIMGKPFSFGLPLSEFGLALLWVSNQQVRRETYTEKNNGSEHPLPTWSWIGCNSRIYWTFPIFRGGIWKFKELVLTSRLVLDNTEDPDMIAPASLDSGTPPRLYTSLGILSFSAETLPTEAFKYRAHAIMGIEIIPPSLFEETKRDYALGSSRLATWEPIHLSDWDDGAGRGIIRGMTLNAFKKGTSMEFVALSSFKSKGEADILYHYHGHNIDASYGLPIINCLVIQWHEDGMAERVGFAQIGSNAWEEAKPLRKAVLLR